MTIGGPQNIFPQGRDFTVNFDWTNVASATGYVSYDCHHTLDNGGVNNLLIESSSKGSNVGITEFLNVASSWTPICITSATTSSTSFDKVIDEDFDTATFKLPRVVKGQAFMTFFGWQSINTGSQDAYWIIKIRKWDGATETDLVSVQTETKSTVANEAFQQSLDLEIPQTTIKKGEQLRVTIEGWTKTSTSNTAKLAISGDPSDSATSNTAADPVSFAAGETRIVIQIPYRMET